MRRTVALGVILLAVGGLLGLAQEGGSPHETVVKEMIAATEQIASALGAIKDAGTAAEARPGLRKAAEQFVEVRKKAEALRQPDERERDRLTREYRKKLDNSLTKLREEITRVRGIVGGPDALQELSVLDVKHDTRKDEKK